MKQHEIEWHLMFFSFFQLQMFGPEVTVHRVQGGDGSVVESQYIIEYDRSSGRFWEQHDEWQPIQLSSRHEAAKFQRSSAILRYGAEAKKNDAIVD